MSFFTHPQALCESLQIGDGTRVWAFAHVLPGAVIGRDCNICDGVFIENDVVVGDRVTVKCGVQLWDGVRLGDDVFIGPNATFTNDLFPRSRVYPTTFARTQVEAGASIGANATILAGTTIGRHAMIGAGAVVTRSVPPYAIVTGNPGRVVGYVDARPGAGALDADESDAAGHVRDTSDVRETRVQGVTVRQLTMLADARGCLTVGEVGSHLPFVPARYFAVAGVPEGQVRGQHAHRICAQFLVCVAGSCVALVDDGTAREEIALDSPATGLYMPPMTWGSQIRHSRDAVLLVFASHHYDPADYIHDYDDFLREAGARATGLPGR